MDEPFSCAVHGTHVVVRLSGAVNERVLEECQLCMLEALDESGSDTVLYDLTRMAPASMRVLLYQRILDEHVAERRLRRAIVVPNTLIAHLARLAFGSGEYRLFYGDTDAALRFLDDATPGSSPDWSVGIVEERRVRDRRAAARQSGGRRERDRAVG